MPLSFPIRTTAIEVITLGDYIVKSDPTGLYLPAADMYNIDAADDNALNMYIEDNTPFGSNGTITMILPKAVSIICDSFTRAAEAIDINKVAEIHWQNKLFIQDNLLVGIIYSIFHMSGKVDGAALTAAVEDRLSSLIKTSDIHVGIKDFHILVYDPATRTSLLAIECLMSSCFDLVYDVYTTPNACASGGFAITKDFHKLHIEGLCNKHRFDRYVNDQLDHVVQVLEMDFESICDDQIDRNWMHPLEHGEFERVEQLYAGKVLNAKQVIKMDRKMETMRLRQLFTRPHHDFDDEPLEVIPLGQSRRQNSSHHGQVFDAVDGGHASTDPDLTHWKKQRVNVPTVEVTLA